MIPMWKMLDDLKLKKKRLLILVFLLLLVRLSLLSIFSHYCYLCPATFSQGEVAANLLDGKFIYSGGYSEAGRLQAEAGRLVDIESVTPDKNPVLEPFVGNMPGYGILLAFFWGIFGAKLYLFAQLSQVFLDMLAFLALYYMSTQVFGEKTATFSGLIYIFFFPVAFLTVVAFRDIFPFFASIFAAYLLFRTLEDKTLNRVKYYLFAGIVAGLFAWLRETSAAIPIFFGLAILIQYGKKEWIKATAIMLFGVLLVLSPWIIRNYVLFHEFIPLSTEMGAGWITGFGEYPNPWGIQYDDGLAFQYLIDKGYNFKFLSPEHDWTAKIETIKLIKAEPALYIEDVARRFLRGLFLQPNPKSTSFVAGSGYSGSLGAALFAFSAASLLGAAYLFYRRKINTAYLFLFLAPALYFPLIYAPFNMGIRHVIVGVWGYYVIWAGILLALKNRRVRGGRERTKQDNM